MIKVDIDVGATPFIHPKVPSDASGASGIRHCVFLSGMVTSQFDWKSSEIMMLLLTIK